MNPRMVAMLLATLCVACSTQEPEPSRAPAPTNDNAEKAAEPPVAEAEPPSPRERAGIGPCPEGTKPDQVRSNDTTHFCSKNGLRHGKAAVVGPDGDIKSVLEYKDDRGAGMWVDYKDGKKHGTTTYWTEDGKIDRTEIYRDGELVSKPEATCPDGTTRREQARVDLSVDSMRKNRFVVQCERKDGTPHGPFRELYPGKTVEREGTYNGGKIDGQVRWYHDTGELFRERTYKNGTPTGTWIDYSSGKKSFQTEYDASGNKTLTRSLHANGKPKTETDFAKDGAWLRMRRYDETGTLTSTEEL